MGKVFFTFSCDDGSIFDLKLAEILMKYGIQATFYIPVINKERKHDSLNASQILELSKSFEVGGHTLSHSVLTVLNNEEAKEEINRGKSTLEEFLGKKLFSFCFPKGKYYPQHLQMIKDAGFLYGRTVGHIRTKNLVDVRNGIMFPTLQIFPHQWPTYTLSSLKRFDIESFKNILGNFKSINDWSCFSLSLLNQTCEENRYFHLWGHSWEIEELNLWNSLENFLKELCRYENIIFYNNLGIWNHIIGFQ